MYETELRARIKDENKVIKVLKKIGAVEVGKIKQRDIYYRTVASKTSHFNAGIQKGRRVG